MGGETTKRPRAAVLYAEAVGVTCPYCGEPAPAPDNGSDMWTLAEYGKAAAERRRLECVACDAAFAVLPVSKAQLVTVEGA